MTVSVSRAVLVASATTLALLLSGPAYAADESDTPTEQVIITAATSNGSGCVGGTADVNLLPNNAGFTVTYHSPYLARAGIGASPTDFRKNCQVNLAVDRPEGFTYAVIAASHRGFAHLPAGATGLQRWSHFFQGSSTTRSADHRFTGPFTDNWRTFDRVAPADLLFAPCDAERNLNVNTELRVAAGTSDPRTATFMAPNWSDNRVDASYRFVWKRC
jgi:hypothetical protein